MKICKVECIYAEGTEEYETLPDDYGEVRDLVFAKLINTNKNRELLKKIPSQKVLDLSIVFYLFRNHDPEDKEILITDEMIRNWEIDPFLLFEDAMSNTRNLLGQMIRPLRELLIEMMRNVDLDLKPEQAESSFPMYVLTNCCKRNGAVCMLYDDVMQGFCENLGSDFYIIPSSIHEVILVPVSTGMERKDLDRIIREVNVSELSPQDVLSEHSYLFSGTLGKVVY